MERKGRPSRIGNENRAAEFNNASRADRYRQHWDIEGQRDQARAHDPAMPFVVLSGFVAADRPADDRARGADAWVCKDDLHRMPSVLRRLFAR